MTTKLIILHVITFSAYTTAPVASVALVVSVTPGIENNSFPFELQRCV